MDASLIEQLSRVLLENPEYLLAYHPQNKKTRSDLLTCQQRVFSRSTRFARGTGPRAAADNMMLDELLVEGFDDEQIWEQIQMRNDVVLESIQKGLNALEMTASVDEDAVSDIASEESEELDLQSEEENEGSEIDPMDDFVMPGEDEPEDGPDFNSDEVDFDHEQLIEEDMSSDSDESGSESGSREKQTRRQESKTQHPSNDGFFDYDEFERFAEMPLEDDQDQTRHTEEDIDVFMDPDEIQNSSDEEEQDEDGYGPRYADFFEAPKGGPAGKSKRGQERKTVEIMYSKDSSDEEPGDDDKSTNSDDIKTRTLFDDEEESQDKTKTPFQQRQEKLQQTISALEEQNMQTKGWQMLGESSAKSRPENSLLDETLDFEVASKPVPVITEEITKSIEDIIRQRILDMSFDDVERCISPMEHIKRLEEQAAKRESRRVELDDGKPQKSLADVYETEYQEQQAKLTPPDEDPDAQAKPKKKEHEEIESLFKDLCYKLDALSNWHFTPAPVQNELRVLSSETPAIQMEEVIPVAVSDAQILAPQEVHRVDHVLAMKTDGELTRAEKQKLRKRRKAKVRKEKDMKEAEQRVKVKEGGILPGKTTKAEDRKILKDLAGASNVTIIGGDTQQAKKKHSSKTLAIPSSNVLRLTT